MKADDEVKKGRLSVMPGRDGVPRSSVNIQKGTGLGLDKDYVVSAENVANF